MEQNSQQGMTIRTLSRSNKPTPVRVYINGKDRVSCRQKIANTNDKSRIIKHANKIDGNI